MYSRIFVFAEKVCPIGRSAPITRFHYFIYFLFIVYISTSLIIHEENTKEINTETEFGYVMKHLHKIKPTFISIFPLNTNLFEMLSSKLLKNLAYGLVFQHTSRCLDILMKHSSSCLIYYLKDFFKKSHLIQYP